MPGLAKKLNLKDDAKVRVLGKPADVDLDDIATTRATSADAVLAFVSRLADVDTTCAPVFEAARADRLAWIAYPKAGRLGTDLNRDILWQHVQGHGIQGVRQVALDDTWSAMRFRPGK